MFNAVGDGGRDLYRLDLATRRVARIAADAGLRSRPAVSPDGKSVVYAAGKPGDRADHIFLRSLDGPTLNQLTAAGRERRGPAFSPDGSLIVFTRDRTYRWGGLASNWDAGGVLCVMNVNGTGLRQIARGGIDRGRSRCSPDGKTILFWNDDGLYTVATDGSRPPSPLGLDGRDAVYSPDGRSLAFSRVGTHRICKSSWPGRMERNSGGCPFVPGPTRTPGAGDAPDPPSRPTGSGSSSSSNRGRTAQTGSAKESVWEMGIDDGHPREIAGYGLFDDPLHGCRGRRSRRGAMKYGGHSTWLSAPARPARDRLANQVAATPVASVPRWLGPFRVARSAVDPASGNVGLMIDPNPGGPTGLVRIRPGTPPDRTGPFGWDACWWTWGGGGGTERRIDVGSPRRGARAPDRPDGPKTRSFLTPTCFPIDNRCGATIRRTSAMGAIAEAIVAYVQPLIDQTDGSEEQLNKALAIGQVCYNLALFPEDQRDEAIGEMQSSLKMDDEEFAAFRRSIVDPMIQRHHEMFPRMHQRVSSGPPPTQGFSSVGPQPKTAAAEAYPGTDRYAPCPCGSGEKYKFCCGKKRR